MTCPIECSEKQKSGFPPLDWDGWHIGMPYVEDQLSIRIIRSAIDQGINFMDNCWNYHDGVSKERMGKALQGGYREKPENCDASVF